MATFRPYNIYAPPLPSEDDQIRLLHDAVKKNSHRYGHIEKRLDNAFITSTGVSLHLNWNTLSIQQTGRDTQLINQLYKIHYLQWLGNKQANILLATAALLILTLLVHIFANREHSFLPSVNT